MHSVYMHMYVKRNNLPSRLRIVVCHETESINVCNKSLEIRSSKHTPMHIIYIERVRFKIDYENPTLSLWLE